MLSVSAANTTWRPCKTPVSTAAAGLLIAQGLNVVYVSLQLGHASPDITLPVYSHLFDQAEHGQRASDALEASFGAILG